MRFFAPPVQSSASTSSSSSNNITQPVQEAVAEASDFSILEIDRPTPLPEMEEKPKEEDSVEKPSVDDSIIPNMEDNPRVFVPPNSENSMFPPIELDVGETVITEEKDVEIKRVPLGNGSYLQVKNTSAQEEGHIPFKIGKISWSEPIEDPQEVPSSNVPKSILKQNTPKSPKSSLSLSNVYTPETAKAFFAKVEIYKFCDKNNIPQTEREEFLSKLSDEEVLTIGLVLEASKREELKKSESTGNNILIMLQNIVKYLPGLQDEPNHIFKNTLDFIEILDSCTKVSPLQLMQENDMASLSSAANIKMTSTQILTSLLYRLGSDLIPFAIETLLPHIPSRKRKLCERPGRGAKRAR